MRTEAPGPDALPSALSLFGRVGAAPWPPGFGPGVGAGALGRCRRPAGSKSCDAARRDGARAKTKARAATDVGEMPRMRTFRSLAEARGRGRGHRARGG